MKKPEPKYKKMDVPRLNEEVKKMNGKSSRHLKQCIDALTDLLDHDEEQHEETAEQPRRLRDTGTE